MGLKAAPKSSREFPRPRIGDDDGITDRSMNMVIVLFTLLTIGISFFASAAPTDDVKYRILLRQAMLDMDRLEYDKAIVKLLEVRANTDENANVNHMLGLCYLYGVADAEKAAFYLNRAAANASPEYEAWDLDEKRAPVESAYHLAKAYEQLGDFALAAECYGQFLAVIDRSKVKDGSRTYAMIRKSADRCLTIALEAENAENPNSNVVLNK